MTPFNKLMKSVLPASILSLGIWLRDQSYIAFYSMKFPQLVLRNGTTDIDVFRQMFIFKEYKLVLGFQPRLIIDAGANVGYASLWFHDRYPQAKIVAIEPEPSNFKALRKNTHGISMVRLQRALWPRKAHFQMEDSGYGKMGMMSKEVRRKSGIQSVTIPDIMRRLKAKRIDILKLDIEGAEKELFSEGYESWLGKVNVIIIELHDMLKPGCSAAFYRAVKSYPFKEMRKGENIILVRKQLIQ
ncbi:MAG: FkbM family methyltransferase [Nanoarchaeota archaeon]